MFGEESGDARRSDSRAVGACVPARDQHHQRRIAKSGEPIGDREAVQVGKLDIEQHNVGMQPRRLDDGRASVGHSPHNREPFCVEQLAGRLSEVVVVVDDQDGRPHAVMVARRGCTRIVASNRRKLVPSAMCPEALLRSVGGDSIVRSGGGSSCAS